MNTDNRTKRKNRIKDELPHLFPQVTPEQWLALERYLELLREWNLRVNLVSRRDIPHLWERHILPSLIPLVCVGMLPESECLDIGSGGGFPALPLKMARPDLQYVLVESVRKKSLFLRKVVRELRLEGIVVVNERVERWALQEELQGRFDWITARAVAPVATLVEWGLPLLKSEGRFLLWKGEQDRSELQEAANRWGLRYAVIHPERRLPQRKELRGLRLFVLQR